MTSNTEIRELINRLARLDAAGGWAGDLNPTQRAVLGYLSRANRFSRSPSHISDYLGTTRGTTTQSLKSLLQKGYVQEARSQQDKRVIRYALTATGQAVAERSAPLDEALLGLDTSDSETLRHLLASVLKAMLIRNNGREFGLCRTCRYHQVTEDGPYCALLSVPLVPKDADQICHEQESA